MPSPPPPPPRPIRACLFDMDGLLLNSEDLYTTCTNIILREHGKPDLPWSIKAQLQGRPGPEAGRIFERWAQLPVPHEQYAARLADLQRQLFPGCEPLPGVPALLHTLARSGAVHQALATSSHAANFRLKTQRHAELFAVFSEERRVLGDDARIPRGRGKPAPDIYLLALKLVNEGIAREGREPEIKPEECLVFEDSVPGVEAGRRAGMQVVWCPHPGLLREYAGREKEVLAGLTGEHKEENIAPAVEGQRVAGAPGEVDDGWAVLLPSLEDFPYERFGIDVSKAAAAAAESDKAKV